MVSDQVVHMGDAAWRARFEQLLAACRAAAAEGIPPAAAAITADRELREWLRHQVGSQGGVELRAEAGSRRWWGRGRGRGAAARGMRCARTASRGAGACPPRAAWCRQAASQGQ